MRKIALFTLAGASLWLCGCGSVVVSTKDAALPETSQPLTSIRYYLPKGRVQVKADWNKIIPGWQPQVSTVYEADPSECYRLARHVNAFFDDQILIRANPSSGLLEAVEATSSDQTINAVASLAAAAASAVTFGASLSPAPMAKARGQKGLSPEELKELEDITNNAYKSSFDLLIDPDNPNPPLPMFLVSPELVLDEQLYGRYDFSLVRLPPIPAAPNSTKSSTNFNGIVVRVPVAYGLTITGRFYKVHIGAKTKTEGGPEKTKEESNAAGEARTAGGSPSGPFTESAEYVVLLPDTDRNYVLPLARIPLVTSSTKVTLTGGMVASLDRSRPSLVAAAAGVPKAILGALIPIPIQINQSQSVSAHSTDKNPGGSSNEKHP